MRTALVLCLVVVASFPARAQDVAQTPPVEAPAPAADGAPVATPDAPTDAPATPPAPDAAAAPVAPKAPLAAAPTAAGPAPSWVDQLFTATGPLGLALHAEVGFLGVLSHRIQFSRDGTDIDYLTDGGQNTLFPFLRLSADIRFLRRNTIVLLYQPLELSTTQVLQRDLSVDKETFRAGTPVEFGYGFSFWRLSYLYDFFWRRPDRELAVGVSLQIRNARITFASRDGTQFRSNEDIGPVPVLKVRARYVFENRLWLGTEIDGFYAGTPGFNGSDNQFIGAILDASLRAGMEVTPAIDAFVNVRTVLGGAVGTERRPTPPSDGYTQNWLYTFSLSLGVTLKAPGRP